MDKYDRNVQDPLIEDYKILKKKKKTNTWKKHTVLGPED